MKFISVADVEDGLCLALCTISGDTIQIDCGSQKGGNIAYRGWRRIDNGPFNPVSDRPDVFILSHFHVDHYNGLLYASLEHKRFPTYTIEKVFYPGIPEFSLKREFLLAMFTMDLRVFGSETGVMEYDFLRAIARINQISFHYRPLFKGNIIKIGSSHFEVLWPPKFIKEDEILVPIKKAVNDFNYALEKDEILRRLHERVREEGIFEKFYPQENVPDRGYPYESPPQKFREEFEIRAREPLPEVTKKANSSLKGAANHLSLALFEDNRFLFLGDLNNYEIREVVGDLRSMSRTLFDVFITPHHGTRWDNSLNEIKTILSITSNGPELCSKIKRQFKKISKISLATYWNGDIRVPLSHYGFRRLWWEGV